ncbi:Uncharacterized conserved protein YutE, UPF0331/DUF86 family [Oceanospirillum multiglobuliferum]|uniref:Toxin-antitoxin antitoxin component n=1 Tax=Oceanospirillum multiglobuliferum TaxID=64969 RepID=A0A1T4QKJ5_9GAMM|nr:DUF86 domain-containing protein [Oceanospirillum multiglobuliferum]OPX56417.1 toxin-antitoxin antitoxin component [Oceanospirillum multiglobuliferum]SKA04196.1 Uncharacterized conserved protein YutE, UPF0331/DUF86 family [Oceanospirillum multiglobuliferum]
MTTDTLLNKSATIERCIKRAKEEYHKDPSTFATDFTRQDAAILNIQRACEAAIDMAEHLVKERQLGLPQSARDAFTLLAQNNLITPDTANIMKKMIGFRNIAVHDYQAVQLPITVSIIEKHLDDFLSFSEQLLRL